MKITLLTIAKSTFPFVREGMEMYEKRISKYISYTRIEIPVTGGSSSLSPEEVKEREGALILKRVKAGDDLILLDEHGERYTSVEWARSLEKRMVTGGRNITFAIGGAYGFSKKVYDAAAARLSLSDMTFSHQIIRLFFTEQLYRAFTIIKGEPYHNE